MKRKTIIFFSKASRLSASEKAEVEKLQKGKNLVLIKNSAFVEVGREYVADAFAGSVPKHLKDGKNVEALSAETEQERKQQEAIAGGKPQQQAQPQQAKPQQQAKPNQAKANNAPAWSKN